MIKSYRNKSYVVVILSLFCKEGVTKSYLSLSKQIQHVHLFWTSVSSFPSCIKKVGLCCHLIVTWIGCSALLLIE